jgi:hypothetical protein
LERHEETSLAGVYRQLWDLKSRRASIVFWSCRGVPGGESASQQLCGELFNLFRRIKAVFLLFHPFPGIVIVNSMNHPLLTRTYIVEERERRREREEERRAIGSN